MAVPESKTITENDLFSALGIGGTSEGGAFASDSSAAKDAGGKSPKETKKTSSEELDDDALIDIFAPGSKRRSNRAQGGAPASSSSKVAKQAPKRMVDPEISAEREAQLKEKARRSRQWKEELQRQRKEKEAAGASHAKTQWSSSASSSNEEDASRSDRGVITVKAKPILLEDSDTREAREAQRRAARDARYTRDSTPLLGTNMREASDQGVDATRFGADDSRVVDHGQRTGVARADSPSNPWASATQLSSRGFESAPSPSASDAFKPGSVSEVGSSAERAGARPSNGIDAQGADALRDPCDSRGLERGQDAFSQDGRSRDGRMPDGRILQNSRMGQRPEGMPYPDPRVQQPYAPYPPRTQNPMPPYYDPRFARQPGMPSQASQQMPEEPSEEDRGGGMRENPLGVVLIVLAVLCVLVAASLLTGLWDISNL